MVQAQAFQTFWNVQLQKEYKLNAAAKRMQRLCIYGRKWTKHQERRKAEPLNHLPSQHPSVAIAISDLLCKFCSHRTMWLIGKMKAACPALARERKLHPCERYNMFWGRANCGYGRWSEPMRGWDSWGHHWKWPRRLQQSPMCHSFPKRKSLSSPKGTETGCSERNLENQPHFGGCSR